MTDISKRAAYLLAGAALCGGPATAQDMAEPNTPAREIVELETITLQSSGNGAAIDRYRAVSSSGSTKTETPLRALPQSVAVVTRDMMRDQGVTTLAAALRNVSGAQGSISLQTPAFESTLLRGFPAEIYTDGLTNYLNTGDPNAMAGVERIEVLKGPNAVLYGGGIGTPLGGIVNIITKKPEDRDFSTLGFNLGSNGFAEPSFDINRRLNRDGTVLLRMNGSYVRSKSAVDVIDTTRYSFSPSLIIGAGTGTRLLVQGYLSKWEQQEYQALPAWGTVAGDFRLSPDLFIGDPDIPDSMSRTRKLTLTLEHDFNETWSSSTQLRYGRNELEQITQIVFGNAPDAGPSAWSLYNSYVPGEQTERTISTSLAGRFSAGGWDHVLLLGADYARIEDYSLMYMDYAGAQDLLAPGTWPAWSMPSTLAMGEGEGLYRTAGAYVQIQSSQGPWHLLGGVRLAYLGTVYTSEGYGREDRLSDTRLLPRIGAVYDLNTWASLYASRSEGMKANAFTFYSATPRPEYSKQAEIGVNLDTGTGLSGTVALFRIERENVPVTDPADPMMLTSITEGQQRSQGLEVDLVWQPQGPWKLIANYAITDAELTADIPGGGAPAGSTLAGVPRHSGGLWLDYDLRQHDGDGWRVGGGIHAASSAYVDAVNLYKTGGYATFDASTSYTRAGLSVGLHVKNLTDRDYFVPFARYLDGRVAPGDGRQWLLTISKTF